ncbi:transcriptional repressor LexA [Streptomyces sp. NPDC046939]|uniref:transcriptional repressor LexA n=1 Tax=Streptomyces sp. NPDC046939 TaxID=3155376 RepID=UPI0033E6356B
MPGQQQVQRGGRPAGIRTFDNSLTGRQDAILRAMQKSVRERGYPPSMRELATAAGLSSTSSVSHQIAALVRKQAVRHDPRRPRAYSLTPRGEALLATTSWAAPEQHEEADTVPADAVQAPLVGRIAAGVPILAEQHTTDTLTLPRQLVGGGDVFALTVTGDSMVNAHILPSDTVIVRAQATAETGEIVAAMLGDGEATVKRFKRDGAHVWLVPENPAYTPLCGDEATILGKVVMVLRSL